VPPHLGLIFALVLFFPSMGIAGTFTAFGPKNYVDNGSILPIVFTDTFTVLNPNTPYTLKIHNGGLNGEFSRIISGSIKINGVEVVNVLQLNATATVIERSVTLNSQNQLVVELINLPRLLGQPPAGITVQITGVDNDPPTITATVNPPPNSAGWNNTDVTVSFSCTDSASGVASCSGPVTLTTEGANQIVSGTAVDNVGNTATASVTVNIDKTIPSVEITSPPDGTTAIGSETTVTGTVSDSLSGIAGVSCNGAPASVSGSTFTCDVPLSEGANTIEALATDVAGNTNSSTLTVNFIVIPGVNITSPENLSLLNSSPITVSGTVDISVVAVEVNGVPATVSGGGFTATGVPLLEGSHTITAAATDAQGNVGTSSITLILDSSPPTVVIDSPAGGATLTQSFITVTGRIDDVVTRAAGGDNDATVTVNGLDAFVLNGSFAVQLQLQQGLNTITATAQDGVGNTSSSSIQVTFQPPAGNRINLVAGNNQTGVVGSALGQPLVVSLTNGSGNPISGTVTFTVLRGDGALASVSEGGRTVNAATDSSGLAEALFNLGARSGAGNQRVKAAASGFSGEVVFSASAVNGPAVGIKTISGENQMRCGRKAATGAFCSVCA